VVCYSLIKFLKSGDAWGVNGNRSGHTIKHTQLAICSEILLYNSLVSVYKYE